MFYSMIVLFTCVSLVLTYWNIGAYDQFLLEVVFPTCAAIMTFSAAIYSVKHKSNVKLRLLMYFMMLSSIAYSAAFLTHEVIYLIHSLSLLLSVSVLLHFTTGAVRFYVAPAMLFVMAIGLFFEGGQHLYTAVFVGLTVGLLVSSLSVRPPLLFVCVLAYVPYVCGYLLPQLFGVQWSLATLSLLLISATFVFTPLVEQLLGEQIQFQKVRYYGYISMATAAVIVLAVIPFLQAAHLAVLYFLLISVVLHVMLYVKEQLDFNRRRFIVTSDYDVTPYLIQVIHHLSVCTSKQQLYTLLEEELFMKYRARLVEEPNALPPLRLLKNELALTKEHIIKFPQKRLSRDDVVWLELLVVYVDRFARSLEQIEELVQKLDQQSSPWLKTLLFQLLEKEKRQVAQELHDTVLQELLHLARTVEQLPTEELRETLHEAAFELREYCEGLHPPLIESHGLKRAVDKLLQKTKLRADFMIDAYIEPIVYDNPLFIYRIIQELLNNAMKHSEAQRVKLSLYEENDRLLLHYEDDGVGLTEPVEHSMGLSGIQERVKAMHGELLLQPYPYSVKVEIPTRREGEQ